jgi:parvulin-like peptidyl-prolyl isomerase
VKLGQPVPIPLRFAAATSSDITAEFGEGFADTLRDVRQGQWQGPVLSGLGLHLLRVTQRTAATPPKLGDVRQRLENDWRAAAIKAAEDKYYRGLLEGYDVVTEFKR